jgi:hypothetical protein
VNGEKARGKGSVLRVRSISGCPGYRQAMEVSKSIADAIQEASYNEFINCGVIYFPHSQSG